MKHKFKKSDLILIDNNFKYIIYDLKKDYADLLPVDLMQNQEITLRSIELIPKMRVDIRALAGCQKLDKTELLYMINSKNLLIQEILEVFLNEVKE